MHAKPPTHLIIRSLIILIIFREKHKLWSSSLCSFLHPRIIYPAWIHMFSSVSILFANTCSDKPERVYLHIAVMIRLSHYCSGFKGCKVMYSLPWSHCCWRFFLVVGILVYRVKRNSQTGLPSSDSLFLKPKRGRWSGLDTHVRGYHEYYPLPRGDCCGRWATLTRKTSFVYPQNVMQKELIRCVLM
jgi:hypothetical protein